MRVHDGPCSNVKIRIKLLPNADYGVQLQSQEWGHKLGSYSMGLRPLVRVSLTPGRHGGQEGREGPMGWLGKRSIYIPPPSRPG